MLVNYRRPRRATIEETPANGLVEGLARRQSMKRAASFAGTDGQELKRAETCNQEVPEVALMYNKHVVPDWLFRRGGRISKPDLDRYKTWQGIDTTEDEANGNRSSRRQFKMPASADDFPTTFSPDARSDYSQDGASVYTPPPPPGSPFTRMSEKSLTPSHSLASSPSLHHATSTPSLPQYRRLSAQSSMTPVHSGQACPLFGGTGSTAVNTKLKDHVFATILKRMRKQGRTASHSLHRRLHHGGRETPTDQEDAYDTTDQEDQLAPLKTERQRREIQGTRSLRGRVERNVAGSMDMTPISKAEGDDESDQHDNSEPIRRVNSEVVMSELNRQAITTHEHPNQKNSVPKPKRSAREESMDRGMFSMDDQEPAGQERIQGD
jgi:inositol-hexakisphosphate kinase